MVARINNALRRAHNSPHRDQQLQQCIFFKDTVKHLFVFKHVPFLRLIVSLFSFLPKHVNRHLPKLTPLRGTFVLQRLSVRHHSPSMNKEGEEITGFEIALVVPKKDSEEGEGCADCVEFLVLDLKKVGLIVERVVGLSDEFIKVAVPIEVLGRAAAELQIRKPTYIGLELQFEWDEVEAFVRQPDGSLFSWCERFRCFIHLIYGIVSSHYITFCILCPFQLATSGIN